MLAIAPNGEVVTAWRRGNTVFTSIGKAKSDTMLENGEHLGSQATRVGRMSFGSPNAMAKCGWRSLELPTRQLLLKTLEIQSSQLVTAVNRQFSCFGSSEPATEYLSSAS